MAEASSTGAQAEAQADKPKYETMVLGLGSTRKELHKSVVDLATKLGCRASDIMWEAATLLLKNPPTVAPVGASPSVAAAPGFWVKATTNDKGKATGISVVEVEVRTEESGRSFFRFKKDDAKGRARAQRQAVRAAQADATLIGLKADTITVDVFEN